ncbi:MAG: hypothetical protein FJW20_13705 [Acidimicrobiia bacterium]|nr:hypothetical protein [Acidimicrobiia bacterium]
MKPSLRLICLLACLPALRAQEVGSGPITGIVRNEFVRAYFRNGFNNLTSLPPSGDVRRYGATGLIQEFPDAEKTSGVRYALVRATTSDQVLEGVDSVYQVFPGIFSFYNGSGLGPNTAGYPLSDTFTCPAVSGSACTWQAFNRNYALFAYSPTTIHGAAFSVRDPFFTRWQALGGISGLGSAIGAEETVNSTIGTTPSTAVVQRFRTGSLYSITAGAFTGRLFAVREPIHQLYQNNLGHTGFLGLPTSEEVTQANGRVRQNFEGGVIEFEPGQPPQLRLPVSTVSISSSASSERLNLGDTISFQATAFAASGGILDGRVFTWLSTNSRVLSIEPAGSTVTARAVGGGSATITAISEGRTSRGLTFFVNAPCCQIGEGAPTAAAQQSFRDAVTRNRLNVRLPAATPVRRQGNGFVQDLVSADDPSIRYLLAKSDASAVTFLTTGAILDRYLAQQGPAGALGFPTADPAGGRQLFQGGALGGNPVVMVNDPILARWALQNFERGAAGLPSGSATSVLSFAATIGVTQPFTGGMIAGHISGQLAGRAFLISGAILAKYFELGASIGAFGLPVGDEASAGGRRRQEFEGGAMEYTPGSSEVAATERERRPTITAIPSTVPAGGKVRIAAGGFQQGATLRFSVSGQPDFVVTAESGAFTWEFFVPSGSASGLVSLRAADTARASLAVGSFLVQAASSVLAQISKTRGDLQTGFPGARLPQPLRILVRDEFGNPLTGVPVRFTPSPGAQIEGATAMTDQRGEAQAFLRLPSQELPALATAEAGRQVVTFSARAAAGSLPGFPRFTQGDSAQTRDALVNAAAAMVRHLQNTSQLAAPNGPADPALLHLFLSDSCVFDSQGERICDAFFTAPGAAAPTLNLWRLGAFTGGNLDIAGADAAATSLRDLLGQGIPVLLALSLQSGSAAPASHFVVAIGVAAGGAILIHDPSPVLNRTTLEEYLGGFSAGGATYRASVASAAQLLARTPSPLGLVVISGAAQPRISSAAGGCGFELSWPDAPALPAGAASTGLIRMHYCDGLQPAYQLDLAGTGRRDFLLSDLSSTGGRSLTTATLPAAFRLERPGPTWEASLQRLSFSSRGVLNGADFSANLAPGALLAVFGQGMAVTGQQTEVTIGGRPATVISGTSFQLNLVAPLDLPPGEQEISIRSAFGVETQNARFSAVAPAVFTTADGRGVILNQNGTLNLPNNPARRGEVIVVYATGLGAVSTQGALWPAVAALTASIENRTLETLFAGLAPGFPGVYQINLRIPDDLPPGLALRLTVRQAGFDAGPVILAVQ